MARYRWKKIDAQEREEQRQHLAHVNARVDAHLTTPLEPVEFINMPQRRQGRDTTTYDQKLAILREARKQDKVLMRRLYAHDPQRALEMWGKDLLIARGVLPNPKIHDESRDE